MTGQTALSTSALAWGLWAMACQPPEPYSGLVGESTGAGQPILGTTGSGGFSPDATPFTDAGQGSATGGTSVGSTAGATGWTTGGGSEHDTSWSMTAASTTYDSGNEDDGQAEGNSGGEAIYGWQRLRLPPGVDGAADLSVGPDGVVWFVSTKPATPFLDEQMFRQFPEEASWHKVVGGARRIAAAPRFSAVCAQGEMAKFANFQWEPGQRVWHRLSGAATDVAIGRAGQRWSCSSVCNDAGCTIHAWDLAGGQWVEEPATAVRGLRIAVDSDGWPWFIDAVGDVYHWDGEIVRSLGPEGCTTAIGVGGAEAEQRVWVIVDESCSDGRGDGSLWSWQRPLADLTTPMWQRLDETEAHGREIDVDDHGQPWITRADGSLWRRALLP